LAQYYFVQAFTENKYDNIIPLVKKGILRYEVYKK